MSKRRSAMSGRGVVLVAAVVLVLGVLVLQFLPVLVPARKRFLSERERRLLAVGEALFLYHCEQGTFPFDVRGGDHALRLLKPYLEELHRVRSSRPFSGMSVRLADSAKQFDDPEGEDEADPPYWDDDQQRIVNSDYEYANDPFPFERGSGPFQARIVVAGKSSGAEGRKLILFGDASVFSVEPYWDTKILVNSCWDERRNVPVPVERPGTRQLE